MERASTVFDWIAVDYVRLEGLAIEKVEASVENDGESSAALERMKLYTWRKRASVII
jgi:hypothetical protein